MVVVQVLNVLRAHSQALEYTQCTRPSISILPLHYIILRSIIVASFALVFTYRWKVSNVESYGIYYRYALPIGVSGLFTAYKARFGGISSSDWMDLIQLVATPFLCSSIDLSLGYVFLAKKRRLIILTMTGGAGFSTFSPRVAQTGLDSLHS